MTVRATDTPVRLVREQRLTADTPLFVHPQWQEQFPWLLQGTTGRGDEPLFDLAFFGSGIAAQVMKRWRSLRGLSGFDAVVHASQVHGARVLRHEIAFEGVLLRDDADGHLTSRGNLLLAVSIADCVPVFIVDPVHRAVAALHAGWRGVVAGIFEAALVQLQQSFGTRPQDLHVHFGPAICGECYEVGPEVHAALGLEVPSHNSPVDLRAALARRALNAGVNGTNVTISDYCTLHSDHTFFSHRRGDTGRQMGLIGIRGE